MASPFNNANIENELTEFLDKSYPSLVLENNVTLGLATHKPEYGRAVRLPVKTGYAASEAIEMSDSVALAGQTQRSAFVFTFSKKYVTEDVDLAEAAYSEDPDLAAVDAITDAMKTGLISAGSGAEKSIWGDGFGTLATIKSNTNPSGNIFKLTLVNPQDAWKFQGPLKLVSKATPATGSLDTGVATVTGVDVVKGIVTVDGGGTWTPVNTHVLGLSKVMAASTSMITWPGFLAFNPDVNSRATLSTTYFNVNRSLNEHALAGFALDCTGQPVKQALNALLSVMSNVDGVRVDTAFLNWADNQQLMDDLGSAKVAISATGEMGVNYSGVQIKGPTGPCNIYVGTHVPKGRIQVCDVSQLIVAAPGKFIEAKAANGKWIEVPDADKARVVFRTNGYIYPANPSAFGNAII